MLFSLTTQELMERPDLWEAVHRLRYKIFVEEMGWEDLRRPDGFERDQFDHDEAIHQIVIRGDEVAGYQRLLPTTRGHLLTEVLTDLFEGTPPSGPNIYELTRYAVAPGFRDGRRGVSTVGTELIAGFVEWGLKRNVNQMIIEFEPMWVLRALQLHFLATPLGYQRTYGNQQVVATLLSFNEHTLDVVRSRRNHFAPVLARGYPDMLGQRRAS
ncbi:MULTISPECIES: acyl-homoserine-lactone synthase [Mesorhizobium]|uniref:Acyl-homoserine-lactone synthase n=1 Tax=Mesorhizobium qingshengii TaxID=1165689 RepID=A0A1G5YMU5_9HYPH|nr:MULTISPECIES: acyl-homoserine-lactone synthase [Mesorhizobium]SDA83696.1 acyl-homoserine lactone synthase [Mesorhizobium qingshengii]